MIIKFCLFFKLFFTLQKINFSFKKNIDNFVFVFKNYFYFLFCNKCCLVLRIINKCITIFTTHY